MTEHCINNGSSICQTKDATHLILTYDMFSADTTVGFTYSGKQAELMLLLNSDPEAAEYRLTLSVTNISDSPWHVALYDDPYNNASKLVLKTLPIKEKFILYPIREYEFGKSDELIIFIKFGDENLLLLEQDIEQEEMHRLWKCLEFLYTDPVFADMSVENSDGQKIPAHRAIIAAASDVLDDMVSSLELITDSINEENDCDEPINKTNRVASVVVVGRNLDHAKEKGIDVVEIDNDTSRKQLEAEYIPPPKKKKTNKTEAENTTESLNLVYVPDKASTSPEKSKSYYANQLSITKTSSTDEKYSVYGPEGASTSQEKGKRYNANQMSTYHLSLARTSSRAEKICEDDNNEKQQMLITFSSFLAKQNNSLLSTSSNQSGAKNMQEVIQEFLAQNSSALKENNEGETFVKPNPRNYLLTMNGLKSETPLLEYLRYIYTGKIGIDIGNDHDRWLWTEEIIDDLICAAYFHNLKGLIQSIESQLIHSFSEDTAMDIFNLAKQYNLETLRQKAIVYIRSPDFLQIAADIEDPVIQKYIISRPSNHKLQKQAFVKVKVSNISQVRSYKSRKFFVNGLPFYSELRISRSKNRVSIYVCMGECGNSYRSLLVDYQISVLSKLRDKTLSNKKRYYHLFHTTTSVSWGYEDFMRWTDLIDPKNAFVDNDSITLQLYLVGYDDWPMEKLSRK